MSNSVREVIGDLDTHPQLMEALFILAPLLLVMWLANKPLRRALPFLIVELGVIGILLYYKGVLPL